MATIPTEPGLSALTSRWKAARPVKVASASTTMSAWCAAAMSPKRRMATQMPMIRPLRLNSTAAASLLVVAPHKEAAARRCRTYAAAAEQLGVTEEALMDALGDPSQGQPDFEAAAATLGVTFEALQEALGGAAPPNAAPPDGDAQVLPEGSTEESMATDIGNG